jgi:DNA polymerase-4
MKSIRKIIHIDMDAFFAAVEQRDFPQYRNKPLIVGGSPDSRGVVATCSYEARRYGIHSAMPSSRAYRLCPHAIFVKPRFDVYQETSTAIRKIFATYTDLVEPVSLDEAYLDVSNVSLLQGSATLIAKAIKADIKRETELTASAGISYNKFLAKIASDIDKPDGLYLITPEQGADFAAQLAVEKFHGIGKATSLKMHSLGIKTGQDLKELPLETLQHYFGKAGLHYHNISRGIDNRPVTSQRVRKSLGVEITFQQDVRSRQDVIAHLHKLLKKALHKVAEKQLAAQTLTIKIKYHDFVQITRSKTLPYLINGATDIAGILEELLKNTDVGGKNIRLLGVTLSSLANKSSQALYRQMDLFNDG